MQNLRFLLAYDGTGFRGWQRQRRRHEDDPESIQEALERAFSTIARCPLGEVAIAGSGRTDAGVHAHAQVASLLTRAQPELELLRRGMNAVLPEGIVVRAIQRAPLDFHARFSARGKVYRYVVFHAPHPPVHDRRTVHWVRQPLDVTRLEEGATHLRGRHDFAAFTTKADKVDSTVRTLRRLDLSVDGPRLTLTFEAEGFLYNMVRALTGILLEVGVGRRSPDSVLAALRSRDRRRAGENAPASGLTMQHVIYGTPLEWSDPAGAPLWHAGPTAPNREGS